jgi:hypothetical protein
VKLRRLMFCIAVLMLIGSLTFLSPSATVQAASDSCNVIDPANKFDGSLITPHSNFINMVSADINRKPAALCSNEQVTAWWVGIVGHQLGCGAGGYAQIGYSHNGASGVYYFWEYERDLCHARHSNDWGSPGMDDFHEFRVIRVNNPDNCNTNNDYCLAMKIDGNPTQCGDEGCPYTNFDPHNVWDSTHAELFGETSNSGSDMPGSDADGHVKFQNVVEQDGPDTVSRAWDPKKNCPNFYQRNTIQPYVEFAIWTDPIAHTYSCQGGE